MVNDCFKPTLVNSDYSISESGKLKRLGSNRGVGYPKFDRIISGNIDSYGYARYCIPQDGKPKYFKAHQLVAIAFIPNPDNKKNVNHKDGNKLNNHVSNLEWCTLSENNYHAYETGLKDGRGAKNSKCKLTEQQVIEIFKSSERQVYLAKKYGVCQVQISSIKTGKSWSNITQRSAA